MKKALLIGKFNTVFKDIYDFLDEKDAFIHIQACPEHIESIKSIIKMTNPGLIIISLISLDKEYQSLFAFIRLKYGETPVLCIGTEAEQKPFEAFLETAQYQAITRPCTNRNIWTHVKAILDISEKLKSDSGNKAYSDAKTEEFQRELEEITRMPMDEQEKRTVTFRDNRQSTIDDDLDDSWIDEALAKQTKAAYKAKTIQRMETAPKVEAEPQNVTKTVPVSQPAKEEVLPVVNKKIRVLLVDDNAIQIRALRSALMSEYEVLMAVSGEESIEVMNNEYPDIVFLDYTMPGYNGKKVLEIVRQSEKLKNMPVVFLTGLQDKREIMSLVALKPNGYLVKPPDIEKIKETIRKLVG